MLLGDIGEGSSALFCLTDRTQCCSTREGGEKHGVWRFPSGSEVGRGGDVYLDRSYSSVVLNIRNNAVGPTGIYTCGIPDAENTNRILYIGLYGSELAGMYTRNQSCQSAVDLIRFPHCLTVL